MTTMVRDLKGRPLTDAEAERLRSLPFASAPPWTPERVAGNEEFRRVIADLYLDGVSMTTLAGATGLSMGAVNQQILKCRRAGMLNRPRTMLSRPSVKAVEPPKHRALTEDEVEALQYAYGNVKAAGDRGGRWESEAARRLIGYMRLLRDEGVTMSVLGAALGVSRERVRQVLAPLPVD